MWVTGVKGAACKGAAGARVLRRVFGVVGEEMDRSV